MCLLLVAVDAAPGLPLVVLANRDEFHGRDSDAAARWAEDKRVVGGRDRVAGGSWLALRNDGRFAAVTNLRTGIPATAPKSRGALVRNFLLGEVTPVVYLDLLRTQTADYGPFNLVVGNRDGVYALGSAEGLLRPLRRGVHVISNGTLGVHWPKTERLQRRFGELVRSGLVNDEASVLDLLLDESQPADEELPDTGVGLDLERRLAPVFIRGDRYGTRASSLLARHHDGSVVLRERRFGPNAQSDGEDRWAALPNAAFETTAAF
ncbi:NRDE family protein [Dokdonella sp.]|uniref:NRDE family protein n=1 Tax=Dokdonella sp. TaxID=2291710 RepID=UPI002F3FBEAB